MSGQTSFLAKGFGELLRPYDLYCPVVLGVSFPGSTESVKHSTTVSLEPERKSQ